MLSWTLGCKAHCSPVRYAYKLLPEGIYSDTSSYPMVTIKRSVAYLISDVQSGASHDRSSVHTGSCLSLVIRSAGSNESYHRRRNQTAPQQTRRAPLPKAGSKGGNSRETQLPVMLAEEGRPGGICQMVTRSREGHRQYELPANLKEFRVNIHSLYNKLCQSFQA